jgi:hypothetical protein
MHHKYADVMHTDEVQKRCEPRPSMGTAAEARIGKATDRGLGPPCPSQSYGALTRQERDARHGDCPVTARRPATWQGDQRKTKGRPKPPSEFRFPKPPPDAPSSSRGRSERKQHKSAAVSPADQSQVALKLPTVARTNSRDDIGTVPHQPERARDRNLRGQVLDLPCRRIVDRNSTTDPLSYDFPNLLRG